MADGRSHSKIEVFTAEGKFPRKFGKKGCGDHTFHISRELHSAFRLDRKT